MAVLRFYLAYRAIHSYIATLQSYFAEQRSQEHYGSRCTLLLGRRECFVENRDRVH